MTAQDFGPFANIVAIATALLAVFSYLAPKVVGKAQNWAWLADDPPTFLTQAPARAIAIVVMAASYLLIDEDNYGLFLGLALVSASALAWAAYSFDRLRRTHIASIPLVDSDGTQIAKDGKPQVRRVVIGSEIDLTAHATQALADVRARLGGISLVDFMSGYGNSPNSPAALWPLELLAKLGTKISSRITISTLTGVLAVFLAALSIDAAG